MNRILSKISLVLVVTFGFATILPSTARANCEGRLSQAQSQLNGLKNRLELFQMLYHDDIHNKTGYASAAEAAKDLQTSKALIGLLSEYPTPENIAAAEEFLVKAEPRTNLQDRPEMPKPDAFSPRPRAREVIRGMDPWQIDLDF